MAITREHIQRWLDAGRSHDPAKLVSITADHVVMRQPRNPHPLKLGAKGYIRIAIMTCIEGAPYIDSDTTFPVKASVHPAEQACRLSGGQGSQPRPTFGHLRAAEPWRTASYQ